MSARSVIEHALHTYYADSQQPDRVVRVLLHNYDHAHRAEVLTADGQEYDGQLAMLTGLIATIRATVAHGSLDDVRKLLDEHHHDDADAREEAKGKSRRTVDTLAAWLHQRFAVGHTLSFEPLGEADRSYWEHEAAAVRRAVARGGFKTDTTEAGEGR
jgi:hypothetical protein